jgi:MYXO-CTERM domain-containing protein
MQAYDGGYLNVTTGVKQADLDKVYNDTISKAKTDLSSGTSNDLLAQIKASLAGLVGGRGQNQFAQSPQYSSVTTSTDGSGSTWMWLALAAAGLVWWFRRKR